MDGELPVGQARVLANLPYFLSSEGRPHYYYRKDPPGEGMPRENAQFGPRPVTVWSARDLPVAPSLDVEGFALCAHRTAFANWLDPLDVQRGYYPEVAALMTVATGASEVIVFDHNVRSGSDAQQKAAGLDPPARRAHNDYTYRSGPQRFRDLLGREPAAGERFAMINLWRPLKTVHEAPLAICDARSIEPADFVATDLIYEERTGEIYSFAYRPGHRWFYVPAMAADEVLFLKCFDSADDGRARFTAHTAFDDPTTPADAPRRESIEARTVVIWKPDQRPL